MKRRKNDILWKGMLEEVFDDLLRFIFPKADQMLKYYARIFDRFDRPLTAIAIFTGRDGKKLPGIYVRKYEGAELTYKYNTLCILDYEDRILAANKNPFALVMLAAKKAILKGKNLDEVLLKEKLAISNVLIKRGYSNKKTKAILSFLHNYVQFEKPETNRIFESEIDRITGKTNVMGIIEQVKQMKIDEAREETREEERLVFVKNLLSNTSFSPKKIADLAGVTISFVNKVKASQKK